MSISIKPSDEILDYLKRYFRYDPETGELERYTPRYGWKIARRSALPKKGTWGQRYPMRVRDVLYRGKSLVAANICWFLHTGQWPQKEIDHRDRDPTNNKIVNLRLSTRALQAVNRTGKRKYLPGVAYRSNSMKPFEATISLNYKGIYLGRFETEIEAHEAYRAKYKQIYGEELDYPYLEWSKPIVVELERNE